MFHIVKSKIRNLTPLPNSDNLSIGEAEGYQVIVSRTTKEDTEGLLFLDGSQVDYDFAVENDLIIRKDEEGNRQGGYFENNCRVRNIKLRGTKTEAFWLAHSSKDELIFGEDEVYRLGEKAIGRKYIPQTNTPSSLRREKRRKKASVDGMQRHYDTCPLKLAVHKINNDMEYDRIIVSEKLHGTSARIAKVEQPIQFNFLQRLMNWILEKVFFKVVTKTKPEVIVGTRNCIINRDHKDEYRFKIADQFGDKLRSGECVYGEIIGWDHKNLEGIHVPIMPMQDTSVLKKKKKNRSSDELANWVYGLPEGEVDFYVYRITMNDKDLPWNEVETRCKELEIKTVPVLFLSGTKHTIDISEELLHLIPYNVHEAKTFVIGGSSVLSEKVVYREGLCLRLEQFDENREFIGEKTYKLKSFDFGVLEGFIKDRGEADVEELS